MTIFAPTKGINPLSRDHEFHNFDKGFHEHHNHAFNLSPTTAGVKKIFSKIYYNFTIWPY